jgi:hypothetical protein
MIVSEIIKILCKNILCVYSKKDKNVYYKGKFEPILYKHKYSSSLEETIRLKNDDNILPLADMVVEYTCPTCLNKNSILLKKFMYKDTLKCPKCREDEEKRKNQSKYVSSSFSEFGRVVKKEKESVKKFKSFNVMELIKTSDEEFKKEPEEFKINYFKKVPTVEEFNKIEDKVKINNFYLKDSIYYPHIRTTHSNKYSPKVLYNGELYLLSNVKYKCDSCGKEFNGRYVKNRSNQYKILCKDCIFCNKTFKIRYTKNIKGNDIRYQSIPELDLIKYCIWNSILIENGPNIIYKFNGKEYRYLIDFKIKNLLIEIKDDHIWHKNELKSGKWQAKEDAAKEYCKVNGLEYRLIMKNDIKSLKDFILRYFYT